MTQPAGTDFALGIEARSRALLSDGETAEELYREAIERLGRTELRPELARAHLLYGEWLRREGRRVDAREQLRTAYDLFARDRHGGVRRARPPRVARDGREGAQAQSPRRATSSRRRRSRSPGSPATASRTRRSARSSSSAPRTVEWHLRKVFAKLGISSRRQLRTALPDFGRSPDAPDHVPSAHERLSAGCVRTLRAWDPQTRD